MFPLLNSSSNNPIPLFLTISLHKQQTLIYIVTSTINKNSTIPTIEALQFSSSQFQQIVQKRGNNGSKKGQNCFVQLNNQFLYSLAYQMSMETASITLPLLNDAPLRKLSNLSNLSASQRISNKIWRYADFCYQDIERIRLSLDENEEAFKMQAEDSGSLQAFYGRVCQKLRLAVHPSLQQKQNISSKSGSQKTLQIRNFKIDILSLIVLTFSSSFFPVECLKFSRNSLTETEAREIHTLLSHLKPLVLFFEWNSLPQLPDQKQFFISMLHQRLQYLVLRQNSLEDEIASQIIHELSSEKYLSLKVLDFSGNHLTNQISTQLPSLLKYKQNLIFLGLAKNSLKGCQFMKMIIDSTKHQVKADEEQKKETIRQIEISLNKNYFNDQVGEFLLNTEVDQSVCLHLLGNSFSMTWVKILKSLNQIRI